MLFIFVVKKHLQLKVKLMDKQQMMMKNQGKINFYSNFIIKFFEFSSSKYSKERLAQFRNLSERPDIYELLSNAIAPSIFGHEDIKKGILLQLFGGTKKSFIDVGRKSFRSQINILLCGDPGTAKSQLQQYIFRLIPRAQYTNGKGTSAVGLTAYVTKDPETGQLVLQT